MEKTTHREESPPSEAWPLRAMRTLLDVTPRHWVGLPWRKEATASPPGRTASQGRYPSGLHSHAMPEWCVVLSGRPFMDIGDRRFQMEAPAVAMLAPRVEHCEGWSRKSHRYEVSWISVSQVSVHISLVTYDPDADWTIRERHTLASPIARNLLDRRFGDCEAVHAAQERETMDLLQADLLAAYGQLHHLRLTLPARVSGKPCLPRPPVHQAALEQVRHLMDHHFHEPWSLDEFAHLTRLTPNYLNRLFRQWTGRSLHRYLTERRMTEALRLCREKRWMVKEIARQVGFEDALYFSRAFHRHHGCSPKEAGDAPAGDRPHQTQPW